MLDSHFSVATVAVVNCLSSEIVDLDSHRDCMNWSRLLKCFMHNLKKKVYMTTGKYRLTIARRVLLSASASIIESLIR